MKNLFFFLFLCATFSLVSCGDDEEDDAPANFMTATINSNAFEANAVSGISDNTFGEELVLIIGTQNSSGNSIGLNIPTSIGTGSNMVDASDFGITFSEDIVNGTAAYFTVGTLNITTNDTTENVLEGSFNFTATDDSDSLNVFNVADGAFRVAY